MENKLKEINQHLHFIYGDVIEAEEDEGFEPVNNIDEAIQRLQDYAYDLESAVIFLRKHQVNFNDIKDVDNFINGEWST